VIPPDPPLKGEGTGGKGEEGREAKRREGTEGGRD